MEDLERIKERLDNIRSVEPILTALRTIAAGSWHAARTRLSAVRLFAEELSSVFRALLEHLPPEELESPQAPEQVRRVGMLVIASERGLCGAFNSTVLEAAERYLAQQRELGRAVELMTLGARATIHFERRGIAPIWSESLPMTSVPSLAFVQHVQRRLSAAYRAGRHDIIHVVYTPYQVRAALRPQMAQLFPAKPEAPQEETISWPPPLIDTDPLLLYHRVLEQWSIVELYRCVIESAASEQSARFQMLDGASNSSQRLIEELTLSYHAARQHAITMEMLDLISGAGLLHPGESGHR